MRSGIRSYHASLLLYGVLRAFGEKMYHFIPSTGRMQNIQTNFL